eukprot:CAMPEP_0172586652 /NCGR_PEP_ID=MMETSP1068-20121228/5974_1 /TAXON_ID=35684 /ORGANISM="Pseudopedinella elastica, Strain CCMP716" /LENGTH=138 /DNA_ID=CAMNT_0013381513 /DNA_START=612 /DNA_END=1025 /DNA_ORIENTATION=-
MSMSDFHPELWNPAWSVRTILVGFVSFMNSEELTTGGLTNVPPSERIRLARLSLECSLKTVGAVFPHLADLARERSGGKASWPPPRLLPLPPTPAQAEALSKAREAAAAAEAARQRSTARDTSSEAVGPSGGGQPKST